MRAELDNVPLAGSVFVYRYDGDNWNFDHKMTPSDRSDAEAVSQRFGYSLAADAGALAIGAYRRFDGTTSDVGAVYFFEEDNGVWVERVMLKPGDGAAGDFFGWDVDLKGNTAVVGSLNHDQDLFGSNFKGNAGAAYYIYNDTNWLVGGKLIWSDRDNGDFFGSSVALTPNEERIIVGMYEDNTRFEFDGDVFNKSESGAAVVFNRGVNGGFMEAGRLTSSIKATGDQFGNSMSASNTDLVIAAHQDDIETFPNSGLCNLDSIVDNGAIDLFRFGTTTGLPDIDVESGISIYPNPTSEHLTISSSESFESVEILNVDGRILRSVPLTSNEQQISTTDLPAGLYFLRVGQRKPLSFVKH